MQHSKHTAPLLILFLATLVPRTHGQDAKVYGRPFKCFDSGSFYNSEDYNRFQATFTPRNSMDCCYTDDTRSMCCLYAYMDGGFYRYQCRCHPSIQCDRSTTCRVIAPFPPTPMPTPTPTTVPPVIPTQLVCPSYAQSFTWRVLNGQDVNDECRFKGMARVVIAMTGNPICQLVYTKANINGMMRDVFVTSDLCKNNVQRLMNSLDVMLKYGSSPEFNINFSNTEFLTGVNGEAYLIPRMTIASQRPCQHQACPYSQRSMPPLESLTDCLFVSYGAASDNLEFRGLQMVQVALSPNGCQDQRMRNAATNGKCFASRSGLNIFCSADGGAPVYCKVPATGETVFVGNAVNQDCNNANDVLIIPFPG